MMLLLVVLLGMYLRGLRTANIYEVIKLPLFRKEGLRGDLTIPIYLKLISPNPSLQKRGFFMMLLLVVLLGMYLRGLRTANIYEAIKLPPLS